jgi:LysM repeat protein
MKKIALFISLCFYAAVLTAQSKDLLLKTGSKGLYLEHKVKTSESFFSLSRQFGIAPKKIATFNKLNYDKGLKAGQIIQIPLTDSNYSKSSKRGVPVYVIVKDKQTLSKISKLYGNVSVKNIKTWNKLKSDQIAKNKKLIIGYLIVNRAAADETLDDKSETVTSVVEVAANEKKSTTPIISDLTEEGVDSLKQEQVVASVTPAIAEEDESNKETQLIKREIPVPLPVIKRVLSDSANRGEGYFKAAFEEQQLQYPISKLELVITGIFKTATGWSDEKYYLLVNGIPAGTIVKLINPVNNKFVYAKVLGEMTGIRQNEGYDCRISNAAAAMLSLGDAEKFNLQLAY